MPLARYAAIERSIARESPADGSAPSACRLWMMSKSRPGRAVSVSCHSIRALTRSADAPRLMITVLSDDAVCRTHPELHCYGVQPTDIRPLQTQASKPWSHSPSLPNCLDNTPHPSTWLSTLLKTQDSRPYRRKVECEALASTNDNEDYALRSICAPPLSAKRS